MFINYSDINRESGVYILKFGAPWCAPCRTLDTTLEDLSDSFDIVKVNVDNDPELAGEFGVMAVPTTFIIVDGVVKYQFTGIKSSSEIKSMIQATEV